MEESAPTSGVNSQESGLALFDGKKLNLEMGWNEAQACLIWQAMGTVECFRTLHVGASQEVLPSAANGAEPALGALHELRLLIREISS